MYRNGSLKDGYSWTKLMWDAVWHWNASAVICVQTFLVDLHDSDGCKPSFVYWMTDYGCLWTVCKNRLTDDRWLLGHCSNKFFGSCWYWYGSGVKLWVHINFIPLLCDAEEFFWIPGEFWSNVLRSLELLSPKMSISCLCVCENFAPLWHPQFTWTLPHPSIHLICFATYCASFLLTPAVLLCSAVCF